MDHHISVAALDVPTLSRAYVDAEAHVSAIGTGGAEVLAVVGDVPGAV